MLKTTYAKKEDIPADIVGAYVEKNGRWELDDLSTDHPVVAKRDELLTKTSTQQGQITRLTNEKADLEKNVLPPGTKAVPEADAQLLDEYKGLGKPPKDLKAVVTEHATLKEQEQARAQDQMLEKAAKLAGYDNPEAFKAAARAQKVEVTFKEETVDGKKVEKAYVGDKPLTEYVDATPGLKALEVAFKTKPQAEPPSTEAGAGNRPGAAGDDSAGKSGAKQDPTYRFQEPGDVKW
jgi:hypothetical protein